MHRSLPGFLFRAPSRWAQRRLLPNSGEVAGDCLGGHIARNRPVPALEPAAVHHQARTSISFLCLESCDSPWIPSSLSPPVTRRSSASVSSILPWSVVAIRWSREAFGVPFILFLPG